MEGIQGQTPFARFITPAIKGVPFTLIDVGCSSGIDDAWRVFGNELRALGFDPNIEDIQRLTASETLPGVSYFAAFVGPDSSDPLAEEMRRAQFTDRNPWDRLSVKRTSDLRAERTARMSTDEKTKLNLWRQVPLADPNAPVVLQQFLRDRNIADVDFVKIDVDGADFVILRSIESMLIDMNVLGVGIEVNYNGSDDPKVHTFHNVDRFMRRLGFSLFLLSTRPYSAAALPAPYLLTMPAQGAWGRILQGDAIYFRDAVAPHEANWAQESSPQKLLKLAALFSIFGLPDCAAEVLLRFRDALNRLIDVNAGLNLLVRQVAPNETSPPSYDQYIAEFEREGPRFWPAMYPRPADPEPSSEAKALREELTSLRNSNSWRLTAPLRRLGRILKRRSAS